ncbi:phosphoribosylformylglycinamidine synthase [Sediminitomix flava]|uniref:Phosphoribosylformylglycinamidine synthase n=1 Tax=Sediminitomix flava TaxID=379075 RepID=A0A315ZAD8_SEDFL|nr:phosphoribosylformylglycinamidine synthase [Sediminitomix flava]PWJ42501.1 phosphoribosylformylglycinamidine synthase [Sediminitomix flava]
MILFYQGTHENFFVVDAHKELKDQELLKLKWLFGEAEQVSAESIDGFFIGPRKEMLTPWSTNAVEITQNMGLEGIVRIEEFTKVDSDKTDFDPMLQAMYEGLDQTVFLIEKEPEPVLAIEDIASYNKKEGLALSDEEITYLDSVAERIGRKLTDSEVFGFSQVNSEHCRHKIFNGVFVIDGEEKPTSLFKLIRKTSETNPNRLVSAYKDNVAFIEGPKAEQFAPASHDKADFFETKEIETVISLKAETHNFPTTVEPFNGAATGSGGEIRDRMAGGKASVPLAGTAVYMTSYSRLEEGRRWENNMEERPWLYQTPMEILIKASNGASDFGNKFGQPLICGSVLTFEHMENAKKYGFDKVIMMAGGVGFGKKSDALKNTPEPGDKIVVMGGDNYRIGMGGGAVSSVDTGEFESAVELNAVQRSNPEMQKRVSNAVRAMAEADENLIVSIHDHGAGGHLNCLSELVEDTGGTIDLRSLPVGDPTLSGKEIVGNESQERMGLVMKAENVDKLKAIAERERAPMYVVGEVTGDMHFKFEDKTGAQNPIDWKLSDMFGNPPKTIMNDASKDEKFEEVAYDKAKIYEYLEDVLQLEAVASKDWLTNKVDRSVTGRVAQQQCVGELQLPLSDVSAMAIDYRGTGGIATSVGHAPVAAMIDPAAGSRMAIAEALTNLVFAPIDDKLAGVSLSANWMWPCKNEGEDARLYKAVEAVSDFACELGINIPTGKDSLSMTQKYEGDTVYSPGTVIISSVGEVTDLKKIVTPDAKEGATLVYVDFSQDGFKLGGSSFAQVVNKIGQEVPTVNSAAYFKSAFNTVQALIEEGNVVAGHDISAGGLITALLEMCFPSTNVGMELDLSEMGEADIIKLLFAEKAGIVLQVNDVKATEAALSANGVDFTVIGKAVASDDVKIALNGETLDFNIPMLRDTWFKTSYFLDQQQSGEEKARERFDNYKHQALHYTFPEGFSGKLKDLGIDPDRKTKTGAKAAIIREKGVNGDREMAYSLHLAGFDVKDVHMTDLISGREDLSDVNMIVFVGGFSNSDVLGSAKGWAGAFLFNEKAKAALDNFYARPDTLSLGVCNGCQVMVELGLVTPDHDEKPKMLHNESYKFESNFLNMEIPENNSVMFNSLSGTRLGVWIAHGEGKFQLPKEASEYNIVGTYGYEAYPANPNGSDYNAAALCSADGRHLVMMPHLERAIFPWNWAHYPSDRQDEVSPWIEAFVNARKWVEAQK